MFILIIVILIIQSIKDIKTNSISGYLNILLLIIGFFISLINRTTILDNILGLTIIPIVLLIINKFKSCTIGDGDIEYLSALGLIFGYKRIAYTLFISSVILFIFSLFKRKRIYPYIPFITIGLFISLLFY